VIQTFFASEKSEEVQIQGRTARQGDPGTWELIVLDKELNKFIGPLWETE
jgi:preprotein translocase subunit SecA